MSSSFPHTAESSCQLNSCTKTSTATETPESLNSHRDIPKLIELANTIKEAATLLQEYITRNNYSDPSLEVNGSSLTISPIEKNILKARSELLSTTKQLQSIVKGPVGILMDIGANEVLCLQVIQRYKIAEWFGIHEEVDFDTLSLRCGLNVKDLQRIVRYAMTSNIFTEPKPGIIAHTAISQILAEKPAIRDFVENVCEVRFPASAHAADALDKYGQSQDANQSGFSMSRNTARGVYDELIHFPIENKRWDGAMSALAEEIDFGFILRSFPWETYKNLEVIDVGGGRGDVSIGLAKRLPQATFVVQDLSETAAIEGSRILTSEEELHNRISFMRHDFRELQTTSADVYYFRNIFHNWPDQMCLTILRNHIPALRPGSRLIIDDFTLHSPKTLPWDEERRRRWMDINMLMFFGSRERDLDEWRALLHQADPRFSLVNASVSSFHPSTILDIAWCADDSIIV